MNPKPLFHLQHFAAIRYNGQYWLFIKCYDCSGQLLHSTKSFSFLADPLNLLILVKILKKLKIPDNIGSFLQKYFDKIFVITLDRAKDRQESTRKYLDGIAFDFFFGADKLQMDLPTMIKEGIYDEGKAKQMNRYGKKMVLGHIACSLSHLNLYKHIVENKYQRVLIFEDAKRDGRFSSRRRGPCVAAGRP